MVTPEQRLMKYAEHSRQGHALCQRLPAFRDRVRQRLQADLAPDVVNPHRLYDLVWAMVESAVPSTTVDEGTLSGAAVLKEWLENSATFDSLVEGWRTRAGETISLHSVLSSHPYAGFQAWLHRNKFPESSSTRRV